jgi:HD-like signal output (HDOD) protein
MSIELVLLGEILDLAQDPETHLDAFGEKVATSPQLAAEVVRVSNSALYGMEGRINRLERAVLILGIRTVAEIASSLLVASRMRGVNIGKLGGDALWMHSLETGVCAQLIARCLSLPSESEAYLAGLLHDLGLLDLYESYGEPYSDTVQRCKSEQVPLVGLEQEAFGETHGERLLARASDWRFPQHLREAIGYHDTPAQAPEASRTLATLIRAAHIIVAEPSQGWSCMPPTPEDDEILRDLGVLPEDAGDIQSLLAERMKEVLTVLR